MTPASARVFIFPRCWDGPAQGALVASLNERRIDTTALCIGPLGLHHRRELVRLVEDRGASMVYERMDGSTFLHRMGQPVPEYSTDPSAA